jgi:acyl carrier protein
MDDKIITILNDTRPEFDFSKSKDFIAEGLLDSFDIVCLVNSLDENFNISIDGLDILPENFSSVERIKKLLIKNNVSI